MVEGILIMVLSEEDKILIRNLYMYKGYSARQLIVEFPEKTWNLRSLNYLLRKLRETDSADRKPVSGRPRTGGMHSSEPEADILNICCNVFVLHCLLTVIFQCCYGVFRLNVRDNNDDVPAYVT